MKASELEQIIKDVSGATGQTPDLIRSRAEYMLTLVTDAEFRRMSAATVASRT